jgi:hypothetical protein
MATATVDLVITGGTGIFAGATGDVTATETVTQTSPTTALISGSYSGSIANIPEPETLALFLPAVILIVGSRRLASFFS